MIDQNKAHDTDQVAPEDSHEEDVFEDAERRTLLRKLALVGAASVPVAMTLLDPKKARAQIMSGGDGP